MADVSAELVLQILQQNQQILQQLAENSAKQQEKESQLLQKLTDTRKEDGPEQLLELLTVTIEKFEYDAENGSTFESWYKRYEDIFLVDAGRLDDAAKVRLLLGRLSTNVHEKYLNFILPKHPRENEFKTTVETLKQLFGHQISLFKRRYNCLQITKKPSDDFITYAGIINKVCEDFEFNNFSLDQFKALVFVMGLQSSDSDIRTRLLAKINTDDDTERVTLQSLIEECQRLTNLKQDANLLNKKTLTTTSISQIKAGKTDQKYQNHDTGQSQTPTKPCWNCGQMHYAKFCSYANHKCKDCGKTGHKEGYCSCVSRANSNSSRPNNNKSSKGRHKGKNNKNNQSTNSIFVHKVNIENKRKYLMVELNSTPIKMQLDCASDITIISKENWLRIGAPSLSKFKSDDPIKSASGHQMKNLSQINCVMTVQAQTKECTLFVSTSSHLNLLGLDLIDLFGLGDIPMNALCCAVKKTISPSTNDTVEFLSTKFPKLFAEELGCCKKARITLHLKPDSKPVFRQKRPVAYAMLSMVNDELQRLEQAGAITKVDFSQWAAPMMVVRKANGKLRICGDYSTGLNEALQSHTYPLPRPEDIFTKLAEGTVFSHIDLSDAFLQVEVDEKSRELLTLNTHQGLYQFNRLPPGVKPAPCEFQQIIDTMINDLEGAAAYIDDMIVTGKNAEEHRKNLFKVLERLQEYGFVIKIEKCKFFMYEIKYLGHVIGRQTIRPDPVRVEAIKNMTEPTDETTLRSFLGAINFYGQYVKSMRKFRGPLDELLKKDIKWHWTEEHRKAFNDCKNIIASDLVLTHYNPELEIIVAADACNYGLGACILHRFLDGSMKPIMQLVHLRLQSRNTVRWRRRLSR